MLHKGNIKLLLFPDALHTGRFSHLHTYVKQACLISDFTTCRNAERNGKHAHNYTWPANKNAMKFMPAGIAQIYNRTAEAGAFYKQAQRCQ